MSGREGTEGRVGDNLKYMAAGAAVVLAVGWGLYNLLPDNEIEKAKKMMKVPGKKAEHIVSDTKGYIQDLRRDIKK